MIGKTYQGRPNLATVGHDLTALGVNWVACVSETGKELYFEERGTYRRCAEIVNTGLGEFTLVIHIKEK